MDLALEAVHHCLSSVYTQFIYHFLSLCQPAVHLKSLPAEYFHLVLILIEDWRSQWPRGLGCRFAAACLLRLWVRIPPGTWMSVCCECWVL